MSLRYSYPEVLRLGSVSHEHLQGFRKDATALVEAASRADAIGRYADSWIVDLTCVDWSRVNDLPARWAGSSSQRAHARAGDSNRLKARRLSDPRDNDVAHNCFLPWVDGDLDLLAYLGEQGDLRKVSLGCLLPGGWWPTHYDFTPENGFKVNLVLSTNSDAVTLLWNARRQELVRRHFAEGELWYLNVGLKHTAHNWGLTPRLYALATYKTLKPEWQCRF